MTFPKIQEIQLSKIKEAKSNANYMEPDKFELLKKAIKLKGFLQPILVTADDATEDPTEESYVIVDGHHRYKAARELGMTNVPCVVTEYNDEEATLGSISMNKLRGELNLTMVAHDLADLANLGWNTNDLEVSGFTTEEIISLIDSTKALGMEDFDLDDLPMPPTGVKEKTKFALEIKFASEDELAEAKELLDLHVGSDGDYGKTILKVFKNLN